MPLTLKEFHDGVACWTTSTPCSNGSAAPLHQMPRGTRGIDTTRSEWHIEEV